MLRSFKRQEGNLERFDLNTAVSCAALLPVAATEPTPKRAPAVPRFRDRPPDRTRRSGLRSAPGHAAGGVFGRTALVQSRLADDPDGLLSPAVRTAYPGHQSNSPVTSSAEIGRGDANSPTAAAARPITSIAVTPAARRSRTPESPLDLLNFSPDGFRMSGW